MPDNGCSIVVVGASAGGVEALQRFVRSLPADFGAPVAVVLHASPTARSYLPDILTRAGALAARHAEDGEQLEAGHIYVAPPDSHLVVTDGVVSLTKGPRENGHRPAIDPLFRTAAAYYDSHVAGVVLSGTLDDAPAPSEEVAQPGELVPFSCPECGGTLWETEAGGTSSYRCRVGHAYTVQNLHVRHAETVERALWVAYRALEERAAMSRRVARRLADRGRLESAEWFERQAEVSTAQAAELKRVLDEFDAAAPVDEEARAQIAG